MRDRVPDRRKGSVWPVAVAAVVLGLLLFWYTPVVLYAANERFFYFPLVQMLPALAVPLLVTVGVLLSPAFLMPPRARRLYGAFLASLAMYSWIQGFLLVGDYGPLDGSIVLPAFSVGPLVLVVLAVAAGSVVVSFGVARFALGLSVFAVALLAHLVILVVGDSNPTRVIEPSRIGSLYEVGSENVIVLLFDAFQSDVFAQVVEEHPELAARLDGFTYYPDTLGFGSTTYVALPTIHSGVAPGPSASLKDHFEDSVGRESFMAELADAGWNAMLLNPIADVCPRGIDACISHDEGLTASGRGRMVRQAAQMIDLSLLRLAPVALKGAVYNGDRWLTQRWLEVPSLKEASDTLLRDFAANAHVVGEGERSVKFLHLQSTHAPATRGPDCSLLEEPASITRETALDLATCALTRVASMVDALEELGVYERSSVILVADHGYRAGHVPSPNVEDASWADLIANANPLLAVKPAGASGPLRSRPVEMSIVDVKGIVCSLAKSCEGADWELPGPKRPRTFMAYDWRDVSWMAPTVESQRRFEVQGNMFDPSSWRELRPQPLEEVTRLNFASSDRADHFGFGWARFDTSEDGGDARWTWGSRAKLFLGLPEDRESRLEFDVTRLPEHDGQAITFELNDHGLGRYALDELTNTLTLVVPPGLADREADEIVMDFELHRSDRDAPNRLERRMRSLAVRFDELRIAYEDVEPAQAQQQEGGR